MATPGRTHISWHDQTGQIHELISYIGFLEAKLQYLQQHHEHCDSWMNEPFRMDIDLPYLPPDIVVANELPPTPVSIQEEVPLPIYKPVPAPSAPISQKVPDGNPRWKRIVDAMVKDWDQSQSWTQKRSALGLDSVERNKYALMAILGYQKETPILNFQSSSPPTSHQSVPNTNTTDALIMSARQYAIDTKALGKNAGLLVQVHVFRELVFASLCVVMEQQNLPIDTINDLMRICMSSSGPANLYRLRRGALWVNRVIRGMIKKGWGHGATEFWLLSGRPVSQYGLLWEACVHSFPYLSRRLDEIKAVSQMPTDEGERIPFFIPLIIKELVGESLTLGQICSALDYEEDLLGGLVGL